MQSFSTHWPSFHNKHGLILCGFLSSTPITLYFSVQNVTESHFPLLSDHSTWSWNCASLHFWGHWAEDPGSLLQVSIQISPVARWTQCFWQNMNLVMFAIAILLCSAILLCNLFQVPVCCYLLCCTLWMDHCLFSSPLFQSLQIFFPHRYHSLKSDL